MEGKFTGEYEITKPKTVEKPEKPKDTENKKKSGVV